VISETLPDRENGPARASDVAALGRALLERNVAQPAARLVRDQEVAGANPAIPTTTLGGSMRSGDRRRFETGRMQRA
jgi:hypothetical protein